MIGRRKRRHREKRAVMRDRLTWGKEIKCNERKRRGRKLSKLYIHLVRIENRPWRARVSIPRVRVGVRGDWRL